MALPFPPESTPTSPYTSVTCLAKSSFLTFSNLQDIPSRSVRFALSFGLLRPKPLRNRGTDPFPRSSILISCGQTQLRSRSNLFLTCFSRRTLVRTSRSVRDFVSMPASPSKHLSRTGFLGEHLLGQKPLEGPRNYYRIPGLLCLGHVKLPSRSNRLEAT